MNTYKGIKDSVFPVSPDRVKHNNDPHRIWVREASTFNDSLNSKLVNSEFVEIKDGIPFTIFNLNSNMGGCQGKKYMRINKESKFMTTLEFSKRSTTIPGMEVH